MKEEWLFPNTFVPVDVETTSALIVEIKRLIDVVGGMALTQPAQEPWCMKMNRCKTKCEDCPDKPAQQGPVAWPIETNNQIEVLAKQCGWDNRRYMTPADYQIWCDRMRQFVQLASPPAAQPAQEPVAWLDEEKKIIYWHNTHETDDYHGFKRSTPLYTTPQQRPWVGLMDEDKETLILKHAPPLHPDYKDDSLHGLLQAANDFLRELNT